MEQHWIKNFNELAQNPNRKIALEIMEAGLDAINTEKVINSSVSVKENTLFIQGEGFDLTKFKRIKVIGFGKSSPLAAQALEKILGSKIEKGVVIGNQKVECEYVEILVGTHPRPSPANTEAGDKIYKMIKEADEEDLIIVLVSGGGSALLCYPESEYVQGVKLYDAFLKSGKTITEMNTIRKHLSLLKGGGFAKIAYPATVVGLIFSDVPGDDFKDVASGATYKDETTIADAQKIISENNLGEFTLNETPKEDKYFEKVHNFVLVSNKTAVEAMAKKVQDFNLEANIISTELYDEVDGALNKIFSAQKENSVVLAAGEPRIIISKSGGTGGRDLHMGLETVRMKLVGDDSVFISFASDGMDNSDADGAVVDKLTLEKVNRLGLDANDYANRFDSFDFFKKTGDMIMTGKTGANVSDLMLLLTKK